MTIQLTGNFTGFVKEAENAVDQAREFLGVSV